MLKNKNKLFCFNILALLFKQIGAGSIRTNKETKQRRGGYENLRFS